MFGVRQVLVNVGKYQTLDRLMSDLCQIVDRIWLVNLQLFSVLTFSILTDSSYSMVLRTLVVQTCSAVVGGSVALIKMRLPSCCGDLSTQAQRSRCIHLRYTCP